MIEFSEPDANKPETIDNVKTWLKSIGISADAIPVRIGTRNGEIVKIVLGDEDKPASITQAQKDQIKAKYSKCSQVMEK